MAVENQFQRRYPDKPRLVISANDDAGIAQWLTAIVNPLQIVNAADFSVDYGVYDRGSQQLAWLDESVRLRGEQNPLAIRTFLQAFTEALRVENVPVGHVKVFLTDGTNHHKGSLVAMDDDGFADALPEHLGNQVDLILNGRVQCAPAKLNRLVAGAFETMNKQTGTEYVREETAYFRPRVSAKRNSHRR